MDPQRRTVRLHDGRVLDVLAAGADSSDAFLMINGTPSGVVARPSDIAIIDHGRWLADRVPGATARLLDREGHLSLAVGSFDRIVDDLLDGDA